MHANEVSVGPTPDGDFDVYTRFVPRHPTGEGKPSPAGMPPPPGTPPGQHHGGQGAGQTRATWNPTTGQFAYQAPSNPASTRQYIVLIIVVLLGAAGITVAVSFGPNGQVTVSRPVADNTPAPGPTGASDAFYSVDRRRERICLSAMGTALYRDGGAISGHFREQMDKLRDQLSAGGGDWCLIFDGSNAPGASSSGPPGRPDSATPPTPAPDPKPNLPPANAYYRLDEVAHQVLLTANATDLWLNSHTAIGVQLRADLQELLMRLKERTGVPWMIVPHASVAQPPAPAAAPPADSSALRALLERALTNAKAARAAVYPVLPSERDRLDQLVGQIERAIGMTE